MSIKEQAKTVVTTTKRVASNAEQFVQACALLVVAAWSYYCLHKVHMPEVLQWVITAALVVIGVRGAFEFIRFLDKE